MIGGWRRRNRMHALGVEDEGFDFGLGALGWELFAVPKETDASRVADADDDLASGVDGGVGGSDESFVADDLSIRGD